ESEPYVCTNPAGCIDRRSRGKRFSDGWTRTYAHDTAEVRAERTTEASTNQQSLPTEPIPTAVTLLGTILLQAAFVQTRRLRRPRQVYPSRLATQCRWPMRKPLRIAH